MTDKNQNTEVKDVSKAQGPEPAKDATATAGPFKPTIIESEIMEFWKENDTYAKVKEKGKDGKDFYFLDGPPYTSGKVHIGTAWNKSLKDMVLRYKRMQGLKVWDRAGYDMHGLPTENATQKKLGLKDKNDIENFGVDKFIDECRALCQSNLKIMNEDFKRLGVWMDFDNAYQSVKKEFMEGEWWLIKKAHEKGRLYEGLRTMTWCSKSESAIAKHELEYQTVKDNSIFVKFKLKKSEHDNEFLIVWTTTPWTIPLNLAVMVNPDVDYVRAKVGDEVWIVASVLAGPFIRGVVDKEFEVLESVKGKDLEGLEYIHPLDSELADHYKKIKKESAKTHTVLLSSEYVDTTSGSGLVHCAPGCGPEDYEVGHQNNIPPYNPVSTKGIFPDDFGKFSGLKAKTDDKKFIEGIDKAGALVAQTIIEHDYPHDWRYHEPVIFRTTKQWFFKIEDLKEQMIADNKKIGWNPTAAFNAFDSWLNNLRDNSISKQRYWGTPIPVWRNEDPKAEPDDYIVIGSAKELEELSGKKIDDLHISTVDSITFKKDGKTYKRIPDVLDVWVDAGTTSWNCLDYPATKKNFHLFPADFILEGKDQIRGWFNLLMIASTISMNKPSFKNCYMHGFTNDVGGRKMSKSIGNVISPNEITDIYGADTLRYYMIGGANPGLDINYNFDDVKVKHKNLGVFWNLHKYLIDLSKTLEISPLNIKPKNLSDEELFIISRMNSTIKQTTVAMEAYNLPQIPAIVESLLLDLSRTYIQLVRDKLVYGTQEEKHNALWTIFTVFLEGIKLLSIVAPFITEKMYLNMKEHFGLELNSIHLFDWPKQDDSKIDVELEGIFDRFGSVQQSILNAREKSKLNVRWPVAEVVIDSDDLKTSEMLARLGKLLETQTNVKAIALNKDIGQSVQIKPKSGSIGKKFAALTAQIVAHVMQESGKSIEKHLKREGKYVFKLSENEITLTGQDLVVESVAPMGWVASTFSQGTVYLNTELNKELEAEGYSREFTRRIQVHRKNAGLQKLDSIKLVLDVDPDIKAMLELHESAMKEKVGAKSVEYSGKTSDCEYHAGDKVKIHKFRIGLSKV